MTPRILTAAAVLTLAEGVASAEVAPFRSWSELVSSNGYTGVVVDLSRGVTHHFRDHLFATEEPVWNADAGERWDPTVPGGECYRPVAIPSRDLLHDAYFGLSVRGDGMWLSGMPVDASASGYDGIPSREGRGGGTGIVRMVQAAQDTGLTATTRVFAPFTLDAPAFALLLEVRNEGDEDLVGARAYAIVNLHLGTGRPGARGELGAERETITLTGDGGLVEQGFAGAGVIVPLAPPEVVTHSPVDFVTIVRDGDGTLVPPDVTGLLLDDASGAWQWSLPALAPGESAWVGLLISYDANPDFAEGRRALAEDWIGGRDAWEVWRDERAEWERLAADLPLPAGASQDETDLALQSAAFLRMAQVRESSHWLRPEWLPGEERRLRTGPGAEPVGAPGRLVEHRGRGAVLASLPPGEWTYAWVRDGAYAIIGMVDAGLYDEAREALLFFIRAEADRYREWPELAPVGLAPYGLSLTRYHGFGVEESDTTCNGDINVEFDGFGLFLHALARYAAATGDVSLVEENWPWLRDRVAFVLRDLVQPSDGLLWPDSSIWEVHWLGRERHFAYSNITAARGLCDAALLAERIGEGADSTLFADTGRGLRRAIFDHLRTTSGAIASNVEELGAGTGYWDAAVLEAINLGLFAPGGETADATRRAVRAALTTPSGMGLFRNDDEFDAHDLSPWGSAYDSMEWVFLDARAMLAWSETGDDTYVDFLHAWVREQSIANYLVVGENYDENSGAYRNNAPMIGFGAGAWWSAFRQRYAPSETDAACGMFFEDDPVWGPGSGAGDDTAEADELGDGEIEDVLDASMGDPDDAEMDREVSDADEIEPADASDPDGASADVSGEAPESAEDPAVALRDDGAGSGETGPEGAMETHPGAPDVAEGRGDAGSRSDGPQGGCGCRSIGAPPDPVQWAGGYLILAALFRRRRR